MSSNPRWSTWVPELPSSATCAPGTMEARAPRMRDLLADFLAELRQLPSRRTAATYVAIAAAFLRMSDRDPSAAAAEAFLRRVRTSGRPPSPATRNQELAALRALARFAIRTGAWPSDPTAGIAFVREPRRDPAVLTSGELRRLFDAARDDAHGHHRARDLAILAVLSQCGLRVHELVGLDAAHVDLTSATLVGVHGKGGTVADVPLNAPTSALLASWLSERAQMVASTEPALFVSSRGTRLSIRSVERMVERLRRAIRTAKKVTPHTLRHTAATLALTMGCDLSTVGDLLRHSDLNTTRRYLHLVDERRRDAVRRLGTLIPSEILPSVPLTDALPENVRPANDVLDDQRGLEDAA